MTFYPILKKDEDALCLNHISYFNSKLCHFIINNVSSIEELKKNITPLLKQFNLKKTTLFSEKLNSFNAKKTTSFMEKNSIKLLTLNNPEYPPLLKEISFPPPILFYKGNIKCLTKHCLGVVGPRKASPYGIRVAELFTQECSQAFSIVSGFARGIDYTAHKTCVKNNKETIAVMGVGLDKYYPYSHHTLANEIIESKGLLLSEFPLFIEPSPFHFPLRNRIISGLSKGIIVCEAKTKSGSLITVQHAIDQNREVFAVPGSIFDSNSEGTLHLIQQGAKCTLHPNDIFEEFQMPPHSITTHNTLPLIEKVTQEALTPDESSILSILSKPMHIDSIIAQTSLPMTKVLHSLTCLELKNCIIKNEGNIFTKNHHAL
ncbi:DNA-protecting protein DprA [Candidatus Marinamargulisbacteria bacterium SCGC AG-343-D04]|nr:DNA-protecting protein DprA [Candidatus Marinamargulisbacteria bacterium SCGC AG-343-D04]